MTPAPLYIVDVCGTLVHDDTTLGLLAFHFADKPARAWKSAALRLLVARWSPLRLSASAAERLLGRHLLKHAAVRLLAGESVEDLDDSARAYARWLIAERPVLPVWRLLPQTRGRNIILASASLRPVVSALAAHFDAGYVASELASRDGTLTGRYLRDLTGQKLEALLQVFGEQFREPYIAISDNLSDRELLAGARTAYVVLRRPRYRARWRNLSVNFLGAEQ